MYLCNVYMYRLSPSYLLRILIPYALPRSESAACFWQRHWVNVRDIIGVRSVFAPLLLRSYSW